MYDVCLKGGRVVDPSEGRDGIFDVAIKDGKIAAIASDVPQGEAKTVIPMTGKIVAPGLIDAHCHPVLHFTDHAVHPDDAGVNSGVLLVNDGGSAGPANFPTLLEMYRGRVKTEMTFFLNVAACGLIRTPEIRNPEDVDVKFLKESIRKFRPFIKGLKLRALEPLIGLEPDVVGTALDVAEETELPLMVHIGDFRQRRENDPLDDFSRSVVRRLRKGDIISHYMTWRPGGMVTPDGSVYPELKEAKERGVILDCSHGKNNFSFEVAEILLAKGLGPDIITTDLSSLGVPYVRSLLVTMSKFLALGMPLADVIAATTVNAAKAVHVEEGWGGLKVGGRANISVLEPVDGEFPFFDGAAGNIRLGSKLLEPRLVLKDGVPLPCRSFYGIPNEG